MRIPLRSFTFQYLAWEVADWKEPVYYAAFYGERLLPPFKDSGFDESRRWLIAGTGGLTVVLGALAGGLFGATIIGMLTVLLLPYLREQVRRLGLPPAESFYACGELLELFILLGGALTLLH